MAVALFYHLTRSTREETVTLLLNRALSAGWRVMLRGTDRAALERLDLALWVTPEDGFLPHGMEGGPQDADQPVLLGQGPIANGASALMLLDGAEVSVAEAEPLQRVWIVFDGLDGAAVARARGQWKALTAGGVAAQYWSEEGGKWEKKAEK